MLLEDELQQGITEKTRRIEVLKKEVSSMTERLQEIKNNRLSCYQCNGQQFYIIGSFAECINCGFQFSISLGGITEIKKETNQC